MKRLLIVLLLFALIQPVLAKPLIVVTIPDFKPIVSAVGGDKVEVKSLLRPNTDPHAFSLNSKDIELLEKAKLIVLANSHILGFEAKIKKDFKNVLDIDDYNVTLSSFPGYPSDPHGYWLKPENAIRIAKAVEIKLCKLFPIDANYFRSNYDTFVKNVRDAEKEAKEIAKDVAGKKCVVMVPGVCYIASSLGMNVSAVLMSEGSGFVSGKVLNEIKSKLSSGEYWGIIVPDFMKNAKGGEIAEELARETHCHLAYVKFSSGDVSYEVLILTNAARIAYAPRMSEGGGNPIYLYITSILCLLEAGIILFTRVKP